MSKTLYLHIGSPKCGSTFLQRVMGQNRARLAAHGIAYPEGPATHPGNAADFATLRGPEIEALFADGVERAVLSHEDLFAVAGRMEKTAAALGAAGVSVQVIAFLRPFSEFIFGDYSQVIKQHLERFIAEGRAFEGRSFERFCVDRARALTPVGFFRGWQRVFPEHPLILRSHRDIRPEIESLLGVRDLDWHVPRDLSNPSLRMVDCDAIAAALNGGRMAPEAIRDLMRRALHQTGAADPGKTPERIAWIEALFGKQTEEIAKEFGFDNRRPDGP